MRASLKLVFRIDVPDGPWASYKIRLGSDDKGNGGQRLPMFPGFSVPGIVAPVKAPFCSGNQSLRSECLTQQTLEPSSSQYWTAEGSMDTLSVFQLERVAEQGQNYTLYGTDSVGLPVANVVKERIEPSNMVVTSASTSFFTGILGLSNAYLVYKDEIFRPIPLVTKLQAHPRISFSYTAGSYGRGKFPPSLVFGGYDAYRIDPSTTLEVDIWQTWSPSESRWWQLEVTMALFQIEMTGIAEERPMISEWAGLSVVLDPITPYLWLPVWICEHFEDAFGIEWNETQQLYFLNASTHERLRRFNPRVYFGLSSSKDDGRTKIFELPYSAFDLNVTYPLVETKTLFFPLKRVVSTNHYVLGRTFFQGAHISVDYDLGYFNLSRANFSTDSHIVPIREEFMGDNSSRITGIGIGSLLGLLAFFVIVVGLYWNLKLKPSLNRPPKQQIEHKAQLHGRAIPWVELLPKERTELETKEGIVEMTGSPLEGVVLHEMDAGSLLACKSWRWLEIQSQVVIPW